MSKDYTSTYLKSLDVENVIGHVQSSHLHYIYDMAKLCLTTWMDESICAICDNLISRIIFA